FKIPYIANSEAAKVAAWEKEGIPADRFTIIYNPVFTDRYEDGVTNLISRSELGVPDDATIVGMVATVRPIKGYEVLVQAAKIILEKHPNAYFLCVGEQQEDYLDELRILADKLGVTDRIIWYGGIDNPYRITPHFTVAVLSSHSESFSNAVLEYSVAGLPIVASDVGGMKEIITDGKNGFLVPADNPEILADRILQLLDSQELRKSFGDAVQRLVTEQFTEAEVLSQYKNFYEKILA
ncbi:MAG: glycosyltransferase, partial [Thermoguttaceae bacterium]